MQCSLCGQQASAALREESLDFCCIGCREVYRQFGAVSADATSERVARAAADPPGSVAYLRVDGMHCASCEILVEKLALRVKGVLSARSNYATATARVVYDPALVEEAELPARLSAYGYRARLPRQRAPVHDERMTLLRLVTATSLAATVMMLYLAFYYPVHLGLVDMAELEPVRWLVHDAVPVALMLLTGILVFYVALPIFRGAWIGIRTGVLNMDNLLAIAILAAYGYSVGQLIAGSLDIYFDVAATIVAVVTVGRYLEREARERATAAFSAILESAAVTARVERDGALLTVSVDELRGGEHVVVEAGEPVPVDGVVISGAAAVDESLMTGEPVPVPRQPGDRVIGGSRNVEGRLVIAVGNVVESQLDILARVLWNAQSAGTGSLGLGDRVAQFFVPTVLLLAAVAAAWSYSSDGSLAAALLAGMATLVVSCPCTFGLAIPLATAVAVDGALRRGCIIVTPEAFERSGNLHAIAFDKTGILTTADMQVAAVTGADMVGACAAAVERHSQHPVAAAIARLDDSLDAADAEIVPGRGALARVEGRRVAVGSRLLFADLQWPIPEWLDAPVPANTVRSYVGWDGVVQGAIDTVDSPRDGWRELVDALRGRYRLMLLTGAESAGVFAERFDAVFTSLNASGKAAALQAVRAGGGVMMIGDGSNDAPSLAAADLGVAFGAPTALAAEAADVIVPGDDLSRVLAALEILEDTRRRTRQNLGWALLYNAIAVPAAFLGLLNPLLAALAMAASSLLVIGNSIRPLAGADPLPGCAPLSSRAPSSAPG